MGTTSNFGWPTPEATDLVKDGWEAIKDLGDAIDTSAVDFGGLTLISTTSFSAVASQSFDNVFSADYDHYKIVYDLQGTSSQDLRFRVRASGSDLTTSTYGFVLLTCASSVTTGNSNAAAAILLTLVDNTNPTNGELTIYNPFDTVHTNLTSLSSVRRTNFNYLLSAGNVNNTTSYDGFTIYPDSGNLSGTITIFGVKK